MSLWDNRVLKPLIRDNFVTAKSRKNKYSAILFPAYNGFCLESLIKGGVVTNNTRINSIERDPLIEQTFRQTSQRFNLKSLEYFSNLSKTRGYFDLAWFDFCGALTDEFADWLTENAYRFRTPESDLFFTFSIANRHNGKYYTECVNSLNTKEGQKIKEAVKHGFQYKVSKDDKPIICPLTDAFVNSISANIYAIQRIFGKYKFKVNFVAYQDRERQTNNHAVPMFTLHARFG